MSCFSNGIGFSENSQIRSIKDVESFASYLIRHLKVNYNPDNDFSEYINYATGEPTFSEKEILIGNRLTKECFNVCKNESVDIYGLILSILHGENMSNEKK